VAGGAVKKTYLNSSELSLKVSEKLTVCFSDVYSFLTEDEDDLLPEDTD
jgi:hypothetical protein